MMKKIVLCSDGTGNRAIKGRGTNVFKIYEAVKRLEENSAGEQRAVAQIAFYDDGVGTESNKYIKLLTGALGIGLSRNVRDLYGHLARSYQPGDQIYLFGFSRGAYTVRTLAGFILDCGILDPTNFDSDQDLIRHIDGAYKAYRRKYKTVTSRIWRRLFDRFTQKRYGFTRLNEIGHKTHARSSTKVHFIGVWDTVSALGIPYKLLADWFDRYIFKFKFPSTRLDQRVLKACHAVSIDDKRKTFHPEMWKQEKKRCQRIEQVWFAGVHANVGGGYPKQGLSLVALDWMIKKAMKAGLEFIEHDVEWYAEHADVHDKLYDSRKGLAAFYPYSPRNMYEICKRCNAVPLVHESVFERSKYLVEGYAPGNLPVNLELVASDKNVSVLDQQRQLIKDLMGEDKVLLQRVSSWIRLRQWLQAIFIGLTALAVYLVYQEYSTSTVSAIITGEASVGTLAEVVRFLVYAGVLLPLLVVYLLSRWARAKIQKVYSTFWYELIHKKGGREQA